VLYGLPKLATGSIMAHEMMHAYLRMCGVLELPLKTEEGMCQLMAYLRLDYAPQRLVSRGEQRRGARARPCTRRWGGGGARAGVKLRHRGGGR
jgi:hypothetical protein